jgi:hypothetical protein
LRAARLAAVIRRSSLVVWLFDLRQDVQVAQAFNVVGAVAKQASRASWSRSPGFGLELALVLFDPFLDQAAEFGGTGSVGGLRHGVEVGQQFLGEDQRDPDVVISHTRTVHRFDIKRLSR